MSHFLLGQIKKKKLKKILFWFYSEHVNLCDTGFSSNFSKVSHNRIDVTRRFISISSNLFLIFLSIHQMVSSNWRTSSMSFVEWINYWRHDFKCSRYTIPEYQKQPNNQKNRICGSRYKRTSATTSDCTYNCRHDVCICNKKMFFEKIV